MLCRADGIILQALNQLSTETRCARELDANILRGDFSLKFRATRLFQILQTPSPPAQPADMKGLDLQVFLDSELGPFAA